MAGEVKLFDGVLLASDFDGTLVPRSGTATPGVKRAIRFFIENGGRFTVCTGRIYHGFHAYSPEIINAPVLLANGAMAYDYAQKEILFCDGIGNEGIEPLRAIASEFPTLSVEMNPFERSYVVNATEQARNHFESQRIPYSVVHDPADAPRPWCKVMLGGPARDVAEAQEFLRAHHPEIGFLPTSGNYLEVLKKGINKGTALLKLARTLGIAPADVYAAGDGYNDVEMLRAASMAFVPANGDEFARACADRVVRSNEEDAIAHVIEILTEIYTKKRTAKS